MYACACAAGERNRCGTDEFGGMCFRDALNDSDKFTRENAMKTKKWMGLAALLLVVPVISGCWLLAAGGAGAYGGYKMKEEGYTVQNPVKKEAPAATDK